MIHKPSTTIKTPAPIGFSSYSNKAFSTFYPENWTVTDSNITSQGCNATVDFVQNPVPKQTLINENTDNLHNLKNPGPDITINGGVQDGTPSSVQIITQILKNVDIIRAKEIIKLGFFPEEANVTSLENNSGSTTPSISIYFDLPKYHKKGEIKSVLLDNGKFAEIVTIQYVAPEKDFSEKILETIKSSLQNTLTSSRCDAVSKN